jgi:hypothetical protein
MDAGLIERVETNVERAASALFAAAVGYAVYGWLSGGVFQPQLAACASGVSIFAYLLCSRTLAAAARREPHFRVPVFGLRELDLSHDEDELLLTDAYRLNDELLLTEADRLYDELLLTETDRLYDELLLTNADRLHSAPAEDEPLILDDILAEIGPDARVVRLFDRRSMPTPGQLKSRIDGHLQQASTPTAPVDASQALSEALAELRRSLR